MSWHVVTVNSRQEIETAARINNAGFIAHCPTYEEKFEQHRNGRHSFRLRTVPLFTRYFFIRVDDAFRKDEFETVTVRLTVIRKRMITDAEMSMINLTALDLTNKQSKVVEPIKINKGDVMKIIDGITAGKIVKAIRVVGSEVEVEFEEYPGRPVKVSADRLARAG